MNYTNWLDDVTQKLEKKMNIVSERTQLAMPFTSINGRFDDNSDTLYKWTNGFWGGILWNMYILTKDIKYKNLAIEFEKKLDGAFKYYNKLDHDVGFMWLPTAGLHYRLEKNDDSFRRIYYAGCLLASRYHIDGKFFRAWDFSNDYVTIIDCLFNIPLLYMISEESGDPKLKLMAMAHADTVMKQHVRDDGSVVHIVKHDPISGEMTGTLGGQGYAEGSAWSRGQAWAVYGFIISYIHTGEKRYLDVAKKTANYFLASCCDDFLPKCDFRSPAEPVVYDASAGAIAACGMIKIAKYCNDYDAEKYLKGAINILSAMEREFCDWTFDEDAILMKCSRRYSEMTPNGRNIPLIFGDYFFVEAIMALKNENLIFW